VSQGRPLPPLLAARYEVLHLLRAGEGVQTLLATDRDTACTVVVKLSKIVMVSPEEQRRVAAEAEVTGGADGPALVPIVQWGVERDTFFTTVPHVPGQPLESRLRQGPLSVVDALRVVRSVLTALDTLHNRDFCHLNVRPSRIVMSASGDPHAVVLPGGIGRSRRVEQIRLAVPSDLLLFASPEQVGLIARPVGERSDLYSAGAVFYACLAGRPPFHAPTVSDLLETQAVGSAPSLRSRNESIPRSVDELARRLLRKDPDDRYHSAEAAIGDVDAILDALGRGRPDPIVVLGRRDRRRSVTEPSLIGRSAEVKRLDSQLDLVRGGHGGIVLLEGESGSGKSRILAEMKDRWGHAGVFLLEGSRPEPDHRRPLGVFSDVLAGVLARAASDEQYVDWVRVRLGEMSASLETIFPELSGLLGASTPPLWGPHEHGRSRSLTALAGFLGALGSPQSPAVVLFDDCQWADDLTLDSLAEWQRTTAGSSHVLIVAAFRPDEIDAQNPLNTLTPLDRISLTALDAGQVVALAESAAGPLPTSALELIDGWSGGNPFMITAALRGLVESGALIPGENGWRLDEAKMDAARVGIDAATVLSGRLGRLSAQTAGLLEAAAVLGSRFDLGSARRVADLDTDTARAAVAEAERARIVFSTGSLEGYSFVHDRLREAVLAGMGAAERRATHRRAAQDLEVHAPQRSFELAYHLGAAGDADRAFRYALPAAREARRRYALDLSEDLYRIAHRAAMSCSEQRQVAGELGEVLKLRGNYEEAISFIEAARTLAENVEEAAWAEAELGDLAAKRGDTSDARRHLGEAVRLLGDRVPDDGLKLVPLVAWEIGVQLAHVTGWETLRRRWRPRRPDPSTTQLASLYDRLLHPLFFDQSTLLFLWALLRQVNLAERGEDRLVLARAYATFGAGTAAAIPSLWRLALRRVDRSLDIRSSLGDLWGEGQSLSYRGTVLYAAGRLEDAEVALERAEELLHRMGDQWEVNVSRWHRALCRYRMGDLAGSVAICERTYQEAQAIGDRQAMGATAEIWAKAVDGDLPPDIVGLASQAGGGDVQTEVSLLQVEALGFLREGEPDRAVASLEEAVRRVARSLLPNVYAWSTLPWLATARRRAVESVPSLGRRRAQRLLKKAKRTAVAAVVAGAVFPQELPHALREAGLIAALEGRERRARWLLDRSLAKSARQGARYEHARTLQARASVGHAAGWAEAAADELTAAAALAELRSGDLTPTPDQALSGVALVQRYDALLQAGRDITAAATDEELCASVRRAATALLRAERCSVIRLEEDGQAARDAVFPFDPHDDIDRHWAEVAVGHGGPVVAEQASDAQAAPAATSVAPRSALYAPIVAGGRPVACLKATHHSVAGFFGEEEKQLAAYLTALVAAAFERIILQGELLERVIAAQEEERARVARDLHDEVGSGLTSLLLGLRPLEAGIPDAKAARSHTEELKEQVNQVLAQVRRLAFDLRPAVLDDLGLGAALRRLAEDVAARHALAVDLEAEVLGELGRLSPRLEGTIYRVVQEALTNVVRHSGAAECSVLVGHEGDRLRVVIEDDGSGFEADQRSSGSLGLRGMKERAALVGGIVRVTSAPDAGTSVVLEVPLD
jgi:signal transduction histidine kinase